MRKIEKYRLNNVKYPIPGTEYAKPGQDETGHFTINKEIDTGLEGGIKERRNELI